MKIVIYQTGQSGGIPIVNWLAGNLCDGEVTISPYDEISEISNFGFYKNRENFETSKDQSIFYQTDRIVDTKLSDGDLTSNDFQVVILRDPMNLHTKNGLFDHSVWLDHAKFAELSMLSSSEKVNEPKKFFILFNKWLTNRSYRDFLCTFLGIKNIHDSVDLIPSDIKIQFLDGYKNDSNLWMGQEMRKYCQLIFPDIQLDDVKDDKMGDVKKEIKVVKVVDSIDDIKVANINTNTSISGIQIVKGIRDDGYEVYKLNVSDGISKKGRVLRNGEKTLGISGIVLNESAIILDCLRSIADYLDYWVINDTGSVDGTQQIILDFFADRRIPGELHQVPWKNFSFNRNVALTEAKKKTDFCILMDADFIAHIKDEDFKSQLKTPGYLIRYVGGLDYRQILLVNCHYDWNYYGVTHEYIDVKPNQVPVEITEFFTFEHTGKGANREDKFERDVKLLLQGIIDEPDNARYYFYLAQSYKDWQQFDDAIKFYEKRISFGKWDEEVFYSHYQIGLCKKRRGDDFWSYVGDFLKAFYGRRHRIEPLYQILEDCAYEPERSEFGLQLGLMAENVQYPTYDLLFIEKPLYLWMFKDMLATCAFTCKKYGIARRITRSILESGKCESEAQLTRFRKNLIQLDALLDQSGIEEVEFQPFQFQRFNLSNKYDRIAVIIVNYNLTERVNSLVRTLKKTDFEINLDIIVVDNGSDRIKPSMYTTVRLESSIGEGLAIGHGLKFATSLELVEGFKYNGYLFMSTSGEILSSSNRTTTISGKSFVGEMMKFLERNTKFALVSPSLTVDSVTQWAQMINLGLNGGVGGIDGYGLVDSVGKSTNLLDLSCCLIRGSWFREFGIQEIINSNLISGYGMDIELSYLARKNGFELGILQNLYLRKISEVGYRIGRVIDSSISSGIKDGVNLSIKEKIQNESATMTQILNEKYSSLSGPIGNDKNGDLYDDLGAMGLIDISVNQENNSFQQQFQKSMKPEKVRADYYESNVDNLISIILNYEKSEGAHKLLMEAIYFRFLTYHQVSSPVLLEIGGAQNTSYVHLDSTMKLCRLAQVYGYHFISVDIDSSVCDLNRSRLNDKSFAKGHNGYSHDIVEASGLSFLEDMSEYVPSLSGKSLFFVLIDIGQRNTLVNDTSLMCQKVTPLISIGGMLCLSLGEEDRKKVLDQGNLWTGMWQMIGQSSTGVIFQKMPLNWDHSGSASANRSSDVFRGGELITKKEFNLK